jgi:hypothetical protein
VRLVALAGQLHFRGVAADDVRERLRCVLWLSVCLSVCLSASLITSPPISDLALHCSVDQMQKLLPQPERGVQELTEGPCRAPVSLSLAVFLIFGSHAQDMGTTSSGRLVRLFSSSARRAPTRTSW